MPQDHNSADAQHDLRNALGICEPVEREQPVQDKERRDLQDDLSHDGESEGIFSKAQRLEHAHGKKIDSEECDAEAESAEESRAVDDHCFIFHEQTDEPACCEVVDDSDSEQDRDDDLYGKEDRRLHPLPVPGCKVITHQRHDALGKSHGHLHRDHIDLICNAHGSYRVRPVYGSKVVQDGHAGHVQEILDGSRNAHPADLFDDVLAETELPGINADEGVSSLYVKKDKEIEAGGAVGQAGGKSCAGSAHVEPPGEDEDRVQDDVKKTSAHGTDACVQ